MERASEMDGAKKMNLRKRANAVDSRGSESSDIGLEFTEIDNYDSLISENKSLFPLGPI
jgi:hypothetical protein